MNVVVFDTETANMQKRFCYNVGYVIFDSDTGEIMVERDYVVEQIWHNAELFSTAYYASKRDLYVKAMRARKATMDKWGYIMQTMIRDFKKYDVVCAYAYNSPFDDGVFTFNCDWFKTQNPFDNVPIYDLMGLATEYITCWDAYKEFCEEHQMFTESETQYSVTAESVYRFITSNPDFVEEHTALADARIEAQILRHCLTLGAELDKEYPVSKVKRLIERPFMVKVDGEVVASGKYVKKWRRGDTTHYTTKNG